MPLQKIRPIGSKSQRWKVKDATAMVASGTDMLSSTTLVMGRDSTTVATKETKAILGTVLTQSNCISPRTE